MAEHELNKIVDDDGEVFNLRDSTKQPTADRVTSIRASSSASDDKYPSEKAVASAIESLDVSSVGGAGKYISAISETDGKISATATTMDTTPTANSTNAVTSGGIKTALDAKGPNAPSEVTIATGDKPLIADSSDSNKVKRASISFDTGVTNTFLRRNGTFGKVLYADEGWGGVFRTSMSPGDTYFLQQRNCFFGVKPSAVAVEYSTDGGTTWQDYGLSDADKQSLFNQFGGRSVYCGKNTHIRPEYRGTIAGATKDLSNDNIADQRLRITICCEALANAGTSATTDKWLYANIRRIGIYMSTQSAQVGPRHCVFTAREKNNFRAGNDTWANFGDFAVSGDSGWNSIPCNNSTSETGITFGDSYNNQYTEFRFEIWSEGLSNTPESSQTGNMMVQKIVAFSELCWTNNSSNSNLANYGMPCTVNATSGNTNFPKGITSGVAIPIGSGGTGATTAIGAEYNILNQVADIDTTINGDRKIALCNQTKSATNGVFRWLKLSNVWTWIKGLLSSESGVNISGSSASCTGNAATATKATQDSDGNAINATYFKSSGNTTLVSGASTKIGTQNGADVKLTLPTIPSGTQLVYDCGTGSTSTTDFDNALAAFNAGNWVIIHSSGNTYHCVGTYNSGLRFKQIANETASIKVNTLNWTRGSAPSVGTQLEPSMPGHTHSQYVEKAGDTMSGNLTISKGANQGDTKFVALRTDTGTTGWFGVGDGGQNHGVYSEKAYANTNNDVDNDTKGWVVRTDENGYSTLTGAVDGLFSKYFGNTETLRGMKRFKFGYSLDLEGDYTHVSATSIIEARLYSAGVSGGTITMLFNASAQGDARSYYRLQVLSSNNWNLNSVCPVLIVQRSSATAKQMILGFVSGGPTSTTLMTFNYTEVKVLPLNGARKFSWSFGWDTNDFNSNTMTMIKPYVYPRAQIGTAVGDANTPVYVKNDGGFGTASGVDVAVALKDAGRGDVAGTSGHIVKVGYDNSSVPATTPSGNSTFAAGSTVGTTKNLVTSYRYDGVAFYKDVDSGNVTVGNSLKWNGYNLAIQNPGNTPAADTIYIF